MYRSITMSEFEQQIKKTPINLLDVREENEFLMRHISEAKNFPLSKMAENFSILDRNQNYSIICQSGSRSQMACQYLSELGYNVVNIMGGMSTWKGVVKRGM